MIYNSFEDRMNIIAVRAWEKWTKNGLNMDEDTQLQSMKHAKDVANNVFQEEMDDLDWLTATQNRLAG